MGNKLYLRCSLRLSKRCSFLSIPQVKWWWHAEGSMEVNVKILWMKTMTTLAINHLRNNWVACWFCFRWNWNRLWPYFRSYLFDLIRLNRFDLNQTSLTSGNIVSVCTAFDSNFSIRSFIRSFIFGLKQTPLILT